jgi:sec-independent protein translocase protein TatA
MFAMFGLSPSEVLVLAAVGLLLFGNRLPEVARSLGKGFVELQKGIRGIENDVR